MYFDTLLLISSKCVLQLSSSQVSFAYIKDIFKCCELSSNASNLAFFSLNLSYTHHINPDIFLVIQDKSLQLNRDNFMSSFKNYYFICQI